MILFSIILILTNQAFSRGYDKSINLKAYGGMGFINPSDINAKLNDDNNGLASFDNYEGSLDKMSSAINFGAILSYQFNYRFNIGLMFDYISSSSISSYNSDTSFIIPINKNDQTINYYEFNQGLSASSIGLVSSYCFYSQRRLLLDLVAGVLYAFKINYYEDIYYGVGGIDNPIQNDASASSLGFLLGVNLSYLLTRNLTLNIDANYRFLSVNSLKGPGGVEYPFTFPNGELDDSAPMSLNLSGVYLGLGLRYDFALGSSNNPDSYLLHDSSSPSFDKKRFKEGFKKSDFETNKNELSDLKIEARKKYRQAVDKKDTKAQDTYNKLYDIIDKLEKGDWDKLSKSQKEDKIDKIKKLLN